MKLSSLQIKTILPVALSALIFGLLGVFLGAYLIQQKESSDNTRIFNYYHTEGAAKLGATAVKKLIDQNSTDYILIDLRSAAEYKKEHIKTAINIPASSMNEAQIVAAFNNLPKNKQIVMHCYSAYCTLANSVGKILSDHKIYVKELTVGWSEWRYHWDLWNPGAKITDGEAYITKEAPNSTEDPIVPCTEGALGC